MSSTFVVVSHSTRSSSYKSFKMKKASIWMHVAAWTILYALWIAIFQNHAFSFTRTVTVQFCYLLFITANYYFIDGFLSPRYLVRKKYGYFLALVFLSVLISAWLRALVALQMNHLFFHPASMPHLDSLFLNSVINISIWVLLLVTGKMLVERTQTHKQLELLERERIRNELDFLKAQINPHAFFNSINTIYGNIDKTNNKARTTLLQFSELLRYQLYECHTEKVCLEKEIEYIKNYIDFQRLRKDENLQVSVAIDEPSESLTIVPLLIVVLIENAFKFVGNSAEKENQIKIKIAIDNGVFDCNVFNTREIQPIAKVSSGIGLINLKRRLQLLYPQKHQWVTNSTNDFYETNLTIQLS
jgi:two-component system LytT family sensor kinase